jgi:uncharacterized membrane protein
LVEYGDSTIPSQLLVFFESASFFPFLLQQKLGFLEFSGYCGGSLGLFLGFSVLSAVELAYFFSVRMILRKKTSNRVEENTNTMQTRAADIASEAFKTSTIHGFKNCVNKQSPLAER